MRRAALRLPLAPEARARAAAARVWRPFEREVADIVGVEHHSGGAQPRMHPWFGISLVRSPTVGTIEARRAVVIDRNSIVLIPPFELFGLRPQKEAAQGELTLLLVGSDRESFRLSSQAALVTDTALGERVSALIARRRHRLAPVGPESSIRSVLEQLAAHATPLVAARPRRTSSLVPVREYLRAHVSQPVPNEELARLSGLSDSHLVHAFRYEFGLPPHAYHLRVRLAAACEMLIRGLAVASVAYECGFADQSHLSRKFKAVYGLTPAAWAAAAAGRNGIRGIQRRDGAQVARLPEVPSTSPASCR